MLNLAVVFILCGLPNVGARLSLGGPCGASSLKATRGCWVGTQGRDLRGLGQSPNLLNYRGVQNEQLFPSLLWPGGLW